MPRGNSFNPLGQLVARLSPLPASVSMAHGLEIRRVGPEYVGGELRFLRLTPCDMRSPSWKSKNYRTFALVSNTTILQCPNAWRDARKAHSANEAMQRPNRKVCRQKPAGTNSARRICHLATLPDASYPQSPPSQLPLFGASACSRHFVPPSLVFVFHFPCCW